MIDYTCGICSKLFVAKESANRKYCSTTCYLQSKRGKTYEHTGQWKGEEAGYFTKHRWVRRWRGTPKLCELCKSTDKKKYEWANISKQYKRDLNDWIRLCTSCHRLYDGSALKTWETRRKNMEAI